MDAAENTSEMKQHDRVEGVPLVRLSVNEDGGRIYEGDRDVLASLLLSKEVAERPVVVISIVGAYRTGKSFLIGFLLRYLKAEPEARADGSWLNDNYDEGNFSWKPGCEPHTSGIHIWPQPLPLTLPNGEEVTVILLDTQGTFDRHSSVRDCSTIFGLSTLLSSVLIFNLKDDIKEDSLQHLEYFTTYGRLVLEEQQQKPFQELKFVVRDWDFECDYEFGAKGGRMLLENRLQVVNDQCADSQDIRNTILSCFQNTSCNLLPRPAPNVTKLNFKGTLPELSKEFVECVLELVPSMLSPENLQVKMINGHLIRGKDLYHYFEAYVDVFNSDKLPEPLTIKNATMNAAFEASSSEARLLYHLGLERACGKNSPALPRSRLPLIHSSELNNAVSLCRASISTVMTIDERESCVHRFEEELHSQLAFYTQKNEEKIEIDILNAFEDTIGAVIASQPICLHPEDLEDLLNEAKRKASAIIENLHDLPTDDSEKEERKTTFEELCEQLRKENERNNTSAVAQGLEEFESVMITRCGAEPCCQESSLNAARTVARFRALSLFSERRNRNTERQDSYKDQLSMDIEARFQTIRDINRENNINAIETALNKFEELTDTLQSPQCVHPAELISVCNSARDESLELFLERCTDRRNPSSGDIYYEDLLNKIIQFTDQYKQINNNKNERAVVRAVMYYDNRISLELNNTALLLKLSRLSEIHEQCKTEATETFSRSRRVINHNRILLNERDEFKEDLLKKINEKKSQYGSQILLEMGRAGLEVVEAVAGYILLAETVFRYLR